MWYNYNNAILCIVIIYERFDIHEKQQGGSPQSGQKERDAWKAAERVGEFCSRRADWRSEQVLAFCKHCYSGDSLGGGKG